MCFVGWRWRSLITFLLLVGLCQWFGTRFLDGLVESLSFLVIWWVFLRGVVCFLGERVLGVVFC